jgi:HK97 family phage portal protein
LQKSWEAKAGVSRAGQTRVLEEGMKWEATGMPLEDAQFIETAKFNDLRVAQLFGIPPWLMGASSGDSMTYSNVESQGIAFVRHSLRRWLVRIENALFVDPSLFVQGSRFYPEFLLDGLLRADTKSRYESYAIALDPTKGWMDRNEVRELENLNPDDEPPVAAPDDEEVPDAGD